jgi:hypothetical protein
MERLRMERREGIKGGRGIRPDELAAQAME